MFLFSKKALVNIIKKLFKNHIFQLCFSAQFICQTMWKYSVPTLQTISLCQMQNLNSWLTSLKDWLDILLPYKNVCFFFLFVSLHQRFWVCLFLEIKLSTQFYQEGLLHFSGEAERNLCCPCQNIFWQDTANPKSQL